jgi:hypothetical protein
MFATKRGHEVVEPEPEIGRGGHADHRGPLRGARARGTQDGDQDDRSPQEVLHKCRSFQYDYSRL